MTSVAESTPRSIRIWLLAVVLLFVAVMGVRAAVTLGRFTVRIAAPGPNSVGEAGKVYFANRFQHGESIFVGPHEPPYYPSAHGPLLHATVGLIGRWMEADIQQLYYIGRAVSALSTLAALSIMMILLRRLGAAWPWIAAAVAVFFALDTVVYHAISYRGDHWQLALTFAACYLIATRYDRPWALALAAALPVISFYVKVPGIAAAGAVVIALAGLGRWRAAVACAIGSVALILLSWWLLGMAVGPAFARGFAGGLGVSISFTQAVACLAVPELWLPLLLPIVVAHRARPHGDPAAQTRFVLTVFWAVSFIASFVAAMRLGSNAYYFVEPLCFGLILSIDWLAEQVQRRKTWPHAAQLALIALVSLYCIQAVPTAIKIVTTPRRDVALVETDWFSDDRQTIAQIVNDRQLRCFSDDPGLNVLLGSPQVIDPMVQRHLIDAGTLAMSTMVEPVGQQAYDLIVLTGTPWSYHGEPALPESFMQALDTQYERQPTPTRLLVFKPRSRAFLEPGPR